MACFKHAAVSGRFDGRMPFPEPSAKPHYAPSRTFKMDHIEVWLSFEPEARTFSGRSRVHFSLLPSYAGTMKLDLDEVTVESVTDLAGSPLPWRLGDGHLTIEGATTGVEVRWHGADPQCGLYFTGPTEGLPDRPYSAWTQSQDEDAHFFMPCCDHPRTKHRWTIHLDAPEGYTLLSNGAMRESRVVDGRVRSDFEQVEPMPAYLFTAVAARLEVYEATWRGRSVRYLVPEGEGENTLLAMGKTPAMLEEFTNLTGVEFPWPRYDQVVVHDFIFGGMENVACTTMTDILLVDAGASIHWDPDDLVAHELAHQWFGDLVTCQDWSQAWLNESWATFMEMAWRESDREPVDATWYAWGLAEMYLTEDGGRYRRPITTYLFREPIDVFDRHLYEKGAVVLRTLRSKLGERAFWDGVGHYLRANQHGSVHSRDFQRAMEEATGHNLDGFFHQWVHGAGHPELQIELGEEKGLATVSVKQTQSGEQTIEVFAFDLPVQVVVDGKTVDVSLPVSERERTFAVPVSGEVKNIRVDPDFSMLSAMTISASTPWLAEQALDPSPVVAVRALRALNKKGTRSAFDAVCRSLTEHPWYGVRGEAAKLLGKRGGADAQDALLGRLAVEDDPRTLESIADSLGNFRTVEVAGGLIASIDEAPTDHVRGAILRALGRTRQPDAMAMILENLSTPSWADISLRRALEGLAATRDPAAFDVLVEYTEQVHEDRIRAAALSALGALGDQVESLRRACRERIEDALGEPGFRSHLSALNALAVVNDPASISVLERIYASAPDGRVRRSAYEALVVVQKGRTTEAGLSNVRTRLAKLETENAALRERLGKLEQ